MNIYYFGPVATFTHDAAARFADCLGLADAELVPLASPAQVIQRVLAESAACYGCVPLENSTEGSVRESWDTLARVVRGCPPQAAAPQIVASLTLRIEQHLLTVGKPDLGEIREVLSHPQALAQCREWLETHLPQARLIAVASTADAARCVREAADPAKAAIGPGKAADVYGLCRRAERIQTYQENMTRFGLIAKTSYTGPGDVPAGSTPGRAEDGQSDVRSQAKGVAGNAPDGASAAGDSGAHSRAITFSLLLSGVQNRPGGLMEALHPLYREGFNLTRIESRPSGHRLGEYVFFIDVQWPVPEVPAQSAAWQRVASAWAKTCIEVTQLGWFPELGVFV